MLYNQQVAINSDVFRFGPMRKWFSVVACYGLGLNNVRAEAVSKGFERRALRTGLERNLHTQVFQDNCAGAKSQKQLPKRGGSLRRSRRLA